MDKPKNINCKCKNLECKFHSNCKLCIKKHIKDGNKPYCMR